MGGRGRGVAARGLGTAWRIKLNSTDKISWRVQLREQKAESGLLGSPSCKDEQVLPNCCFSKKKKKKKTSGGTMIKFGRKVHHKERFLAYSYINT